VVEEGRASMSDGGALFVAPRSTAAGLAGALAWLWRLGPLRSEPLPTAVGIGGLDEAADLERLVRSRELAGAVVLASESGPRIAGVPARRRVSGVARFGRGLRVVGTFTVFDAGRGSVTSALGCHAIREGGLLVLGSDPSCWGRVDWFWALATVADFLVEALDRPLVQLPPIGCLRLDDVPGTAEHQLQGRAHGDRQQRRRVARLVRLLARFGSRAVVAVPARAFDGDRPVSLDTIWPLAVAELARGVSSGVLEPACHGTLHLDTEALEQGRVEPREFGRLGADEAGRRLDEAIAWLRDRLGPPASFVAPAWGYSPGTLEAAARRQLPSWLPPEPAPLLEPPHFHETLAIGLPGLHRLDYEPLRRLAATGLPPTIVFHGRLLDHRLIDLKLPRDLMPLARLAVRRDLSRLVRLAGVRWVGAAELLTALRAHDQIEVNGDRVELPPGAEALVRDRTGSRLESNRS
jgi:hypothetical protein